MKIFEPFGPVKHVTVASDANGKSKGFGFVTFAITDDALKAVQNLQQVELKGRIIKLEVALRPTNNKNKKSESDAVVEEIPKTDTKDETIEEIDDPVVVTEQVIPEKSVKDSKNIKGSKPALQVLVMGVPESMNKRDFQQSILSKACRKATCELVKEDHFLSPSLNILHPGGKIFLISVPSRKDVDKVS